MAVPSGVPYNEYLHRNVLRWQRPRVFTQLRRGRFKTRFQHPPLYSENSMTGLIQSGRDLDLVVLFGSHIVNAF